MPQRTWSAKRERQYEHIKDSLLERGEKRDTAEEIAAAALYLASDESRFTSGTHMVVDGGWTL